jgi:O-antigen/teichoic acid export membrane protein
VATTPKATAQAAPTREMLRYAAVTSVTVVLTFVVWRRTEFFFLDHYSSDAEIGYYAIGFSAVAVLGVLPDAIGNALLPAVANLHGARATERIATGYARILRLLLTAALPLTAAAFAVGPALVQLVYGDSYKRAGTVLLVLVAPFPILGIMNVSNALLAGIGRIIPPVVIGVVATVVNLSLDFLLIPRYDAVGAAIANIAAQLTAAMPVILLASRSAGRIPFATGSLIRIAAAAALGGVAARLTVDALGAQVGVVLGLIVGAAIFAGAVYASRALLREDVEWLRTTPAAPLARVLRPFAGRAR